MFSVLRLAKLKSSAVRNRKDLRTPRLFEKKDVL